MEDTSARPRQRVSRVSVIAGGLRPLQRLDIGRKLRTLVADLYRGAFASRANLHLGKSDGTEPSRSNLVSQKLLQKVPTQPSVETVARGGAYAQALFFDERLLFLEQCRFGLQLQMAIPGRCQSSSLSVREKIQMFRQMQGHFDYLWDHLSIPLIPDAENKAST